MKGMAGGLARARSKHTSPEKKSRGAHTEDFAEGTRVRFYLPNSAPDGLCTGTVMRVITREADRPRDRPSVNTVSRSFPGFLVCVDETPGPTLVELTGPQLTRVEAPPS